MKANFDYKKDQINFKHLDGCAYSMIDTCFWELHLLEKHHDPTVSKIATGILKYDRRMPIFVFKEWEEKFQDMKI